MSTIRSAQAVHDGVRALHGLRGKAPDGSTWRRGLDMALVHYGVGLFPVYAGMALAGADAAATAVAARVVERVRKAMAELRL